MSLLTSAEKPTFRYGALGIVSALLVAELVAISLLYNHGFEFSCRVMAPDWFCSFAGRIVPRALGVLAAISLFILARQSSVRDLFSEQGQTILGIVINLVGFLLVLLPWFGLSDASSKPMVTAAIASWSIGGILTALGLGLILAPAKAWVQMLQQNVGTLAVLVGVGLILPEVGDLMQPFWRIAAVTEITFSSVVQLLSAFGYEVIASPAEKEIGNAFFGVAVGPQCSGVEGFVLITVFLTLYIGLFRRDLRFPNALLLYPIGLFLSFIFNIIRITILLMIGFEGQPDLAIGGFHSHAGWLAFTTLSVLLILTSRAVPWFMRGELSKSVSELPPFFQDPSVAKIFPFIVFMASALIASTLSQSPGELYVWRALAMGCALALVWPFIRSLPWRIDMLAIAAGAAIAVLWIIVAPSQGDAPYGGLVGGALTIWLIARVIGTTLFVPIIEELLFRDYLISLIAPAGKGIALIVAVAVSTAAFAALHDRWLVAAVAGLIFVGLVLRSKNVTDAILAHGVANGLIAIWAFATGAWHIL